MTILQQGPARSMGGPSVDESPPQKKAGGARQNAGGPGPTGPPHATGLVGGEVAVAKVLYRLKNCSTVSYTKRFNSLTNVNP